MTIEELHNITTLLAAKGLSKYRIELMQSAVNLSQYHSVAHRDLYVDHTRETVVISTVPGTRLIPVTNFTQAK